jgi:dihydrofolate synthase / folylpolyglutamate synthase
MLKVLSFLGNPHLNLKKNIIISGTNGKGTVATILNKIYSDSGYKVGLYTSPHLIEITERIRISNKKIREKILDRYLGKCIEASSSVNISLSFFELLTTSAILYFSKKKNDINIFEVGLGGKFDATNVIKSKIGIITNIEKDHVEFLGDSLKEIAYEKIGITNIGSKLITSAKSESLKVFDKYCKKNQTQIFRINKDFSVSKKNKNFIYTSKELSFKFKSKLKGAHQNHNLGVAIKAIELSEKEYGLRINNLKLEKSLSEVFNPARFQTVSKDPLLIIDVSHNIHSIKTLIQNYQLEYNKKKINIIIGMLKDKNPLDCIKLLKKIAKNIYLTEVPNERSFQAKIVAEKLKNKNIHYIENNQIPSILSNNEEYLITGSIYLLGSILKKKYVKVNIN